MSIRLNLHYTFVYILCYNPLHIPSKTTNREKKKKGKKESPTQLGWNLMDELGIEPRTFRIRLLQVSMLSERSTN